MTSAFDHAKSVADAVLYEGYLLYPYRASAAKNQSRWQFGVLVPPSFASEDIGEYSTSRTECVLDGAEKATVHVRVRFLQVQEREVVDAAGRSVESLVVSGREYVPWQEAVEQERDIVLSMADLLSGTHEVTVAVESAEVVEEVHDDSGQLQGRLVRRRCPLSGLLSVQARRLPGPYGGIWLRTELANTTGWDPPEQSRDRALRYSFVAAHVLLGVTEGAFLSMVDPPQWAKPAVELCENVRTWPVLLGASDRSDSVLSAPIILYDDPSIAPESPQQLFDGTEIDEILTLRTMALTDDEKRQARLTDDRARELVDGVDDMPGELLERLHGTMRYLRSVQEQGQAAPADEMSPDVPWWDPGADASVSPETDSVHIGDSAIAKGSKVRLNPRLRRTDAQDMFLIGRMATVQGVFLDVDDEQYLAVTLDDDPGADLQGTHGRYRYFFVDEVEPLPDQALPDQALADQALSGHEGQSGVPS